MTTGNTTLLGFDLLFVGAINQTVTHTIEDYTMQTIEKLIDQKVFHTETLSQWLDCSIETVRRAYRDGRLRGYRPRGTRRVFFLESDVKAWLESE